MELPFSHDKGVSEDRLKKGVHLENDDTLVWNKDSLEHPRNWPAFPRYYTAVYVTWLEFYMTLISSAGAAAAEKAVDDFPMSTTLSYFAFISVYLLGQTIGGIFCSPISEFFGRRTVYIIGTVLYAAASALTAATPSVIGIYFGRFFQGVAAAIPATVAFGNFNDCFDATKRIWIVYFYTCFGISGLALGPVYSTYVTLKLGWRWVFYISTIASGASVALCFFMRETSADQLLKGKAEEYKQATGKHVHAKGDEPGDKHPMQDFLQNQLYRPLLFLFTEPLVLLCAVLNAIAFGLIYGLTESLTIVYTTPPFDDTFDKTTSSLSFLALVVGIVLNIFPRFYDDRLLDKCRNNKKRILPETKIRSFAIACPALAIGLWIFAWTIPQRVTNVPWPISMIGLICIGFAANDFSYVLFGYVTDAYGDTAASAVSSISTTRTIAAAAFPLFTSQMYQGLVNNAATTILAAVATLFCATPFLFLRHGENLRHRSNYAAKNKDCLPEENSHMKDQDDHAGEKKSSSGEDTDRPASHTSSPRIPYSTRYQGVQRRPSEARQYWQPSEETLRRSENVDVV